MAGEIDVNSPWVTLSAKSGAFGLGGETAFRRQIRQLRRGPSEHIRMDIESDHLVVNMNATEANAAFGAALQQAWAAEIEDVSADAAPATVARRKTAFRNRDRGVTAKGNVRFKNSYRLHYAGGRIGELPPDPNSNKLLNDSGRIKLTTVRPRQRSQGASVATMNFPANRLKPGLTADVNRVVSVLQANVPMARGELGARSGQIVDKALDDIAEGAVAKSYEELRKKRRELRQKQLAVARMILRAVRGGA